MVRGSKIVQNCVTKYMNNPLIKSSCLTKQSVYFVYMKLRHTLFCYDLNFKSAEWVCPVDSQEGVGK